MGRNTADSTAESPSGSRVFLSSAPDTPPQEPEPLAETHGMAFNWAFLHPSAKTLDAGLSEFHRVRGKLSSLTSCPKNRQQTIPATVPEERLAGRPNHCGQLDMPERGWGQCFGGGFAASRMGPGGNGGFWEPCGGVRHSTSTGSVSLTAPELLLDLILMIDRFTP